MKVTKVDGFIPIQIVLETENEAKLLWVALNHFGQGLESAVEDEHIGDGEVPDLDAVGVDMWEEFNKSFRRGSDGSWSNC